MPASPHVPRCQVVPRPDDQVAFLIDGVERTRWHFGVRYPRPFLYPLNGPSGTSLTGMGHPGAPNHDHHRSVWFAHHKVTGVDFWSDRGGATIRQQQWLAYEDGDDEALMAVLLAWRDGHDPAPLLQQELMIAVRPGPQAGETLIELQSAFKPTAELLEFQQTNFGFLAVRVARSLSEHFGGGRLSNDAGAEHEARLFAKPARWMDYSGPIRGPGVEPVVEGLTYFDHPSNPNHPAHWHVREDGWMGAAACLQQGLVTRKSQPLRLRYLLHAHSGEAGRPRAATVFEEFAERPPLRLESGRNVKHRSWLVRRQA